MRVVPSVVLRRAAVVLAASVAAAATVYLVSPSTFELRPGERSWERAVSGATPSGRVLERALVRLGGLPRNQPGQVVIRFEDERVEARVGVDGGPTTAARSNLDGELVVSLPPRAIPSAVLEVVPAAEPLRISSITVTAPVSTWPVVLALALVALTTAGLLERADTRVVLGIGLAVGAMLALPFATARLWLPLALLLASVLLGRSSRVYWGGAALAASLIFGMWVRIYFLPSAGSWDTEYWKAWTDRAVSHGTTHVYGDADAVGDGAFIDQMRGKDELWRTEYRGREFVVDYPPGAMAIWRWSWITVRALAPGLDYAEAENVAVKLPAVVGDIAAVALLLWIFRRAPARGLALAALYWVFPVSWLSSGVLGFLDGAYAPFAVGAIVAASAGRSGWAGVLVAIAALIKPQALIIAPAAAVVLARAGGSLYRATASGLGVVGASLVPFVMAGTLDEAVTHVFRILFQQRLSAGYANPWWFIGSMLSDEAYAPKDLIPIAGLIAVSAFAFAIFWICSRTKDGLMMAGGLIFAYAMLALGVHHNHPHVMFLAFLATGIRTRHFGWLVGVLSVSYVLNMLSSSGIGRFYGDRYIAWDALATGARSVRHGLGFDLTLVLALVNVAVFVAMLDYVRRHE